MVEQFIEGHYYRCILDKRPFHWNQSGQMDYVLDNRAYKCTYVESSCSSSIMAKFEFVGPGESSEQCVASWNWGPSEFIEVDPSTGLPVEDRQISQTLIEDLVKRSIDNIFDTHPVMPEVWLESVYAPVKVSDFVMFKLKNSVRFVRVLGRLLLVGRRSLKINTKR